MELSGVMAFQICLFSFFALIKPPTGIRRSVSTALIKVWMNGLLLVSRKHQNEQALRCNNKRNTMSGWLKRGNTTASTEPPKPALAKQSSAQVWHCGNPQTSWRLTENHQKRTLVQTAQLRKPADSQACEDLAERERKMMPLQGDPPLPRHTKVFIVIPQVLIKWLTQYRRRNGDRSFLAEPWSCQFNSPL